MHGEFVQQDKLVYLEWLEKAANQNNPRAMHWLGTWFRNEGGDKEKAVSYYRASAELGWKSSMDHLAEMLRDGVGCDKDWRQAIIWSAKGNDGSVFYAALLNARSQVEDATSVDLDCDLRCYLLGWGLYWYQYGNKEWRRRSDAQKEFGNRCIDFYCSCVELQQKSIFTFLLFWNRTIGIKGPGQMIGKLVWEQREDNLVRAFEEIDGEEPETKRIKK
jgi:hypothetical protein